MRHVLAVLVENNPGVLARVAALIRRRGFNIESLAVGPTEDRRISRMTLAVEGDDAIVEQVEKQLNKLVEVLKVSDLDAENSVTRELALVKVHAEPSRRAQILQLADIFRARVVDVGRRHMTIEVTGTQDKVEALINLAREYGIQEVVRTGVIALERGGTAVKYEKEDVPNDAAVLRLGR
ncbi:acetolactate synthase small subunit [Caldinitratiruptor microaerophilus]|uniref:Acetolactate synthase small subunit n=1 Tax=Caldinitratiruptor microaerophilus TaxID=671077 RepID=A0AA35G6G4_9FIRM|nr:acetolactate synthase small subunit [Caldinitratiruptor microaerophilus]BDG58926.1 acetolactate synthase small subunit [Caldinitratiruptor microaerophilus]